MKPSRAELRCRARTTNCPNCGASASEGAIFCVVCGGDVRAILNDEQAAQVDEDDEGTRPDDSSDAKQARPKLRIPAGLLAVLIVASITFLGWCGSFAYGEYRLNRDSRSWPATNGKVLKADVYDCGGDGGASVHGSVSAGECLDTSYEYPVHLVAAGPWPPGFSQQAIDEAREESAPSSSPSPSSWSVDACISVDGKLPYCDNLDPWLRTPAASFLWVAGEPRYESSRVRFSGGWDITDASDWAQAHPPGSLITVYYDPDDPATSVLEPGRGVWGIDFELGFVAVWAIIIVTVILARLFRWLRSMGTLDYPRHP